MNTVSAAYEVESRARSFRGATGYGLIGCTLLLATIPLDHVRFPQLAGLLLVLRFAGVVALAAVLGILHTAFGRRHPRALGVAVACTAGAAVDAQVFVTGGVASPVNLSLILVLLGVALLVPWPPAWSALVCAVVVTGWVGSALAGEGPIGSRFVDNLLVLVATSGLAVITTAMLERRRRREFAQAWALRESEERLRTVIANAPVVLFTLDRAGIITLSEGKGLARLGLSSGDLVGRHVSEVVSGLWRSEQRDAELLARAQAGEAVTWVGSIGGAVFECRMSPLEDGSGGVAGVIGLAIDVTERKHAEDARLTLERRLLEAEKLESLGVLTGGIAHDFNNLLVSVLGNVSLALQDTPAGSRVRATLERIETAARRGSDLTRQMLAYAGAGSVNLEWVDVNTIVEETQDLLRGSLAGRTPVRYQLAGRLPAIKADPTQLRQVVMNLVINAWEAAGDGDGEITVRTSRVHLTDAELNETRHGPDAGPGPHVCLEVADTGCGMDAATMGRVFDPFFSTKFAGRGLGLATVLGAVRSHRGALQVSSEPGRGTTFRIFLPSGASPAADGQPAATGASLREEPEGRTVLLIDDEEDVRSVTADMLERLGCSVLLAGDGLEGVEVFRAHAKAIDAVILDLTLPRMSGERAFQEIRSIRPDACVILMSGYDDEKATRRLKKVGLAGFLRKPFSVADLRSTMGRARQAAS
jgi:PAS domain S-box-containing protein